MQFQQAMLALEDKINLNAGRSHEVNLLGIIDGRLIKLVVSCKYTTQVLATTNEGNSVGLTSIA